MPFFEKVEMLHFKSIDSTNSWVKEHAKELNPDALTCVTADEQTGGRGRLGRVWLSLPNNLFATLYFSIEKTFPYIANLGQILSLCAAKTLRSYNYDAYIKWPNDLLLNGKKVSGILAETIDHGSSYGIVLGIGINIEIPEDVLKQIDQPAISLSQIKPPPSKTELLEKLIAQFISVESFSKEEYESLLAFKDEKISYYDGNHLHQGTCAGITDEGKLRLILPSGEEQHLISGDIIY